MAYSELSPRRTSAGISAVERCALAMAPYSPPGYPPPLMLAYLLDLGRLPFSQLRLLRNTSASGFCVSPVLLPALMVTGIEIEDPESIS